MKKVLLFVLLCSLLMIGVSVNAGSPRSFYVIRNGNNFPNGLNNQIAQAGGTITNRIDAAGLIVVSSANPNFAASISGVRAVVDSSAIRMYSNPVARIALEDSNISAEAVNPPNNDGSYDTRYPLLWGLDAVNAPEAWDAGSTGNGVRVAVLDGGFNVNHPDLAANIVETADMTGEGIAYGPNDDDPTGIFSHGTHVAGTIAAPRNGLGVIGVAYDADLILVKVLENVGSGSFEDVIEGIIYAANADADVINMSLGADIAQGAGVGSNEVAALRAAMNNAVSYAYQSGATVIVAAGNDGRDLDHDQSITVFPAGMPHAISISATAPIGWALDPANAGLDFLASYSNYGRSGVDFAAPGGDASYPGDEICLIGGVVQYCYVFDFVFSTGGNVGPANYYYWSAGTSMAAPHASGIAALIIAENGGSMHPAQVKAEMARRADDLGQSGNDPAYGGGRLSSGY